MKTIDQLIQTILPEAIKLRHELHKIPELKFQEFKTSALIQTKLTEFGYQNLQVCAETGVVAMLDSGKPGKTIALRADIDALPFSEKNTLPYRSQHAHAMHACGHDGHTATLLAVAWVLQQIKHLLHGKVKLIFQPAEEGGKGSSAMIAAGVLQHPSVDAIFGYHNWPGLPKGSIAVKSGALLAGNGRFEIQILGKVAHTAMPHLAINPVTIGASIIAELERLRQTLAETDKTILNVIHMKCGELKGGMTDTAVITGVYYIEDMDALQRLKSTCQKIIAAAMQNTKADIQIQFREYHSPTINSDAETDLVLQVARENFPFEQIIPLNACQFAADDFSEYLKHVPGCYFLIGSGETTPSVHTDQFDFPDEILAVAIKMLCLISKKPF